MPGDRETASADAVPVPAAGGVVQPMGSEILIYLPESEVTTHLNETMALIWRLCDGKRTVGEIVAALVEAYPEAREEIAADVKESIDALVRNGVISLK